MSAGARASRALLLMALCVLAQPLHAGLVTVHTQGYDSTNIIGAGRSDYETAIYGFDGFRAAQFVLNDTYDLRQVTWVGTPLGTNVVGPFTIYLLNDSSANTVGSAIGEVYNGQPLYEAFTDIPSPYTNYKYTADITPTTLGPGTYWISIAQNAGQNPPTSFWWGITNSATTALSAQGLDSQTTGYSSYFESEFVFSLAAIPEPSTAALLVLAAGSTLPALRRRKAALRRG